MVDVTLDKGESRSLKAAFQKKNSGTGNGGVLRHLLVIAAVTVLALDAAEFISLGIVKQVLGLKVVKVKEFIKTSAVYEKAKTQMAEKEQEFTTLSLELTGLRLQSNWLTGERDKLTKEADDKQNQINAMTGERDAVTGERDTLKKELQDLTAQIANLNKQIDEATVERTDKAKSETVSKKV